MRLRFALLASLLALASGCGDDDMNQTPNPDAGPGPDPEPEFIECRDKGDFPNARAHWLDATTIAWPAGTAGDSFEIAYADCDIRRDGAALAGADGTFELTEEGGGVSPDLRARFPHLGGYRAFNLPADAQNQLADVLDGQFLFVARDTAGDVVEVSRVQIPGVLDDLYTYDGPLGVSFSTEGKATLRLWAPTARWVKVHVYDPASKEELAVADLEETQSGVWTVTEPADQDWYGHYYLYEVYVFVPKEREYVANMVTDPYSVGLSQNSEHSLIVDLDDPATKPAGWDALVKPDLDAPEDIVLYELHVRDFSAQDTSVPAEHRGKFVAFTYDGSTLERPLSAGMNHLQQLATSGLTHIHLLPAFDIATIDEDPIGRVEIDDLFDDLCAANSAVPAQDCTLYAGTAIRDTLAGLDPQGEDIQRIVSYLYELDGFNWGYDPLHYTAPEGSYASEADGITRIVEFRQMVQALAQSGLRVVLDVVYNHTNSSGQNPKSVLDRVVPGYYHRLNADGEVERSTCCENTATEHAMMEKLMVDSVVTWARAYKVDSFRFDLMGHHMKSNMLAVQQSLATLNMGDDGVDGSKIFVYGEGWNFGEVGNDARGENATQLNMPGTGIATFSDRLRDAVRGGGPFDDGDDLRRRQGFATGLFYEPNEMNSASQAELDQLMDLSDWIRAGMAGNLAEFVFAERTGLNIRAADKSYFGSPVGYTLDPQEVITYIAAHDNQTLWDSNQYKLATGTSTEERVRVQNLGVSIVTLGQGIPFLHAGMDTLRSKSFTRDSYNSGDWYNAMDWTYQTNNWNVGMPRMDKDGGAYTMIRQVLGDPSTTVDSSDIMAAVTHLRETLQIRKSSPLFRLRTAADVMTRVDYHDAHAIPGYIMMSITDGTCAGADLDPNLDAIVVIVNAFSGTVDFGGSLGPIDGFELHAVQRNSADTVVQDAYFDDVADEFSVPARTVAVFVQPQGVAQGAGLPCNTRVPDPPPGGLQADVFVRGTMNNWTAPKTDKFVQDPANEDLYTVTLMLDDTASPYEFKVANESWDVHNWGIDSGNLTPGDGPHTLASGAGNITLNIGAAGMYRFTLDITDIANPTIEVTMQ